MNDASFRRFYRDALGRNSDKEALIVDTRGNGGGWLHDDLVSFLDGKPYLRFMPRNKALGELGNEPLQRWSRPSVVLQNEENYSDAHVFPYIYQHLGVGKLVGSAVAGTGTAVWWERQIDGETVFGIPQVGLITDDGKYLENLDLQPDVEVRNDPGKRGPRRRQADRQGGRGAAAAARSEEVRKRDPPLTPLSGRGESGALASDGRSVHRSTGSTEAGASDRLLERAATRAAMRSMASFSRT